MDGNVLTFNEYLIAISTILTISFHLESYSMKSNICNLNEQVILLENGNSTKFSLIKLQQINNQILTICQGLSQEMDKVSETRRELQTVKAVYL